MKTHTDRDIAQTISLLDTRPIIAPDPYVGAGEGAVPAPYTLHRATCFAHFYFRHSLIALLKQRAGHSHSHSQRALSKKNVFSPHCPIGNKRKC